MWWISRFKVSKLMKRPQQIARNSVYEIIYEKIPQKSLAELPIVLCHYCGLLCVSSRRKRPIFWYGLQPIFAQPISADKQPPIHKSTKDTASMFIWIVYIANLSLSWISDTGLFALLLFLTEKSIFRLRLKGWKQSTALPVEHFQLSNFIRFGELLGQLGWKLDMPKTVYFLEAFQQLQILSSITRYHMSY